MASSRSLSTRLTWRDLGRESLAGLVQRPGRTVLTLLGPVLGIGAFVAVTGLTATASGQITSDFSVLAATQVTVSDAGAPSVDGTVDSFPPHADESIDKLNGVVAAGTYWTLPVATPTISTSLDPRAAATTMPVVAATPGFFRAAGIHSVGGATISDFENTRKMRVAVVGSSAATQLGIHTVSALPSVVINGIPFTVIGIAGDADRDPASSGTIYIPALTARQIWGAPSSLTPSEMLIHTRLGAAPVVAKQAALALRPDAPSTISVTPPVAPSRVENRVASSLATLFEALAALVLFIGATGIANTTLVAVVERTPEIGLRRAMGARPTDIASQFLAESAVIGAVGGLIGSALGTVVVVSVALANSWTAVMDPSITISGPLVGAVIGFAAGVYPARRASRVQPVVALRQS